MIRHAEVDDAKRFALVNVVDTDEELSGEEEERFEEAIHRPNSEAITE